MYTLTVENKYGQQMELTNNEAYVIESILGLDPPDAVINTTRNASSDGSVFNSSYLDNRTITITIAINGPAEENRINLYKYFKNKQPVKLYYENDSRRVNISGYVEKNSIGFFQKKQVAQITVLCPEPYFNGDSETYSDFSNLESLFEFPFEIVTPIPFGEVSENLETNIINNGDVETGATFILKARGWVENPTIYRTDGNEYFTINGFMYAGDEIHINTIKNKKSIYWYSGSSKRNIIGKVKSGSTWFQLVPGDNLIGATAETGEYNLDVYCYLTDQFEGV